MSIKTVDVAQKSVSCREKQDDDAQKNHSVLKKVIFLPERRVMEKQFSIEFSAK